MAETLHPDEARKQAAAGNIAKALTDFWNQPVPVDGKTQPRWTHFDAAGKVTFDHSVRGSFFEQYKKVSELLGVLGYTPGKDQRFTAEGVAAAMNTQHEAFIPGKLIRNEKSAGRPRGVIAAVTKENFRMPQMTPNQIVQVNPMTALHIELENLPRDLAWQMDLMEKHPGVMPEDRLELDPLVLISRAFQSEITESLSIARDLQQFVPPRARPRCVVGRYDRHPSSRRSQTPEGRAEYRAGADRLLECTH